MSYDDETFRCSECNREFPKELIEEFILNGKTAYCEHCGYPFKLTDNVKRKIGKKTSSSRKKKATSFGAGYPRKNGKIDQNSSNRGVSRPRHSVRVRANWEPRTSYRNKYRGSYEHSQDSDQDGHEKEPERTPQKDIDELKKGIDGMLTFLDSPFILIIGIVVTVGRTIGLGFNFSIGTLASIVINMLGIILLHNHIRENILPKLKDNDLSNIGIDAIAFGAAGLPFYGMGLFILAEGSMVLAYEVMVRRNELIEEGEKKFDHLGAEIIARTIHILTDVIFKATILILIAGIPILINFNNIVSGAFWPFLVFLVLSLFLLSYISNTFVPSIKRYSFDELEEKELIKSTIFSAICLGNGTGAILLAETILIFVHREIIRKIEKSEDRDKEVLVRVPSYSKQEQEPSGEDKEKKQREEASTRRGPVITLGPKIDDRPAIKSKEDSKELKLEKLPSPEKKDRESKKPGLDAIPLEKSITNKNRGDKKAWDKAGASFPDKDKEEQIQLYLNRIFTVLSGEVRKRIIDLDIPEKEKYEVLQEFVNLTDTEREKYLEELETVNRKISQELVTKIVKMDLTYADKQKLIDQLKVMTPSDQLEFIRFLTVDTNQQADQ